MESSDEPTEANLGADTDHGEDRPVGMVDRDMAPGLARLAIGAWWRTGVWTAETTYRASRRLAQAATSGDSAIELMEEAQRELAAAVRKLLGLQEEDPDVAEAQRDSSNYDDEALRNRWEDLLDLSLEVE